MWENNLFNFATIVLPRLMFGLPRPFKMGGIERDDDTLQHKAVREAMTNAIIHSDLMIEGVLKVEKYDDRFVFTNPGLLKLPIEQIYAGGESKARNQNIQTMFRMIGFGENIGSGFPLILSAWNEKHWLRPELVEQPDLLQVKLVLHIDPTNDPANDPVNDPVKILSITEKIVLDALNANPSSSREDLANKLSISEATIKRAISKLKKLQIIERVGSDKKGYWRILTANH